MDLQVFFPLGEKGLNFPSQGKNEGNLFGAQIRSIGGQPVDRAPTFETDQKEGMPHLVGLIAQTDIGEIERISTLLSPDRGEDERIDMTHLLERGLFMAINKPTFHREVWRSRPLSLLSKRIENPKPETAGSNPLPPS